MYKNVKSITLLIPLLLLLASGCSFSTEWTGFYYKNGDTMADPIMQAGFKDSPSCLAWASSQKQLLHDERGSFECGSNCKIKDSNFGLYVCDETLD